MTRDLPNQDAAEYECQACGIYRLSSEWVDAKVVDSLDQQDRVRLCGVVRDDTDRFGRCKEMITVAGYANVIARHREPKTPLEQLDRLVLFAADHTEHLGAFTAWGGMNALARRLYLPTEKHAEKLLLAAAPSGYFDLSSNVFPRSLSVKGWERAERLSQDVREFDQAFVAMWFHPGMNEAFSQGFVQALRACGYNPFRVDQAADAGKIDDVIIANIRKSRILIADLTGCRPNVFYEAGFAHGLGRNVIYTCQQDYVGHFVPCEPTSPKAPKAMTQTWFEQISQHAFDVRQYPVLRWKAPDDLAKALQARIDALGLSLK